MSFSLLSWGSSHYATNKAAPIEQLQRGARNFLQYGLSYSDWQTYTGFTSWYKQGQSTATLAYVSINYVAPDVSNDQEVVSQMLGQAGEKLCSWHNSYSFSAFHQRVVKHVNILIIYHTSLTRLHIVGCSTQQRLDAIQW